MAGDMKISLANHVELQKIHRPNMGEKLSLIVNAAVF